MWRTSEFEAISFPPTFDIPSLASWDTSEFEAIYELLLTQTTATENRNIAHNIGFNSRRFSTTIIWPTAITFLTSPSTMSSTRRSTQVGNINYAPDFISALENSATKIAGCYGFATTDSLHKI
jgi:hypothetical protein